jgi:hypothetical protein
MSSPDTDTALYSKLTGASAVTNYVSTRVYDTEAPRGAAFPYLIFNLASGLTPNIIGDEMYNAVYRVTAVSVTSALHARQVAHAAFDALHEQTLTLSGWTNYHTQVEQELKFTDNDASGEKVWRHVLDVRILASKD